MPYVSFDRQIKVLLIAYLNIYILKDYFANIESFEKHEHENINFKIINTIQYYFPAVLSTALDENICGDELITPNEPFFFVKNSCYLINCARNGP